MLSIFNYNSNDLKIEYPRCTHGDGCFILLNCQGLKKLAFINSSWHRSPHPCWITGQLIQAMGRLVSTFEESLQLRPLDCSREQTNRVPLPGSTPKESQPLKLGHLSGLSKSISCRLLSNLPRREASTLHFEPSSTRNSLLSKIT